MKNLRELFGLKSKSNKRYVAAPQPGHFSQMPQGTTQQTLDYQTPSYYLQQSRSYSRDASCDSCGHVHGTESREAGMNRYYSTQNIYSPPVAAPQGHVSRRPRDASSHSNRSDYQAYNQYYQQPPPQQQMGQYYPNPSIQPQQPVAYLPQRVEPLVAQYSQQRAPRDTSVHSHHSRGRDLDVSSTFNSPQYQQRNLYNQVPELARPAVSSGRESKASIHSDISDISYVSEEFSRQGESKKVEPSAPSMPSHQTHHTDGYTHMKNKHSNYMLETYDEHRKPLEIIQYAKPRVAGNDNGQNYEVLVGTVIYDSGYVQT